METSTSQHIKWLKPGLLAASLLATGFGFGTNVHAGDETHSVYMLGGNEFIIRKMPAGHGKVYLYAYRLSGTQWEEHSIATIDPRKKYHGNSIPEQIYYKGRRIGSITIDLDNPLNTDLNLHAAP